MCCRSASRATRGGSFLGQKTGGCYFWDSNGVVQCVLLGHRTLCDLDESAPGGELPRNGQRGQALRGYGITVHMMSSLAGFDGSLCITTIYGLQSNPSQPIGLGGGLRLWVARKIPKKKEKKSQFLYLSSAMFYGSIYAICLLCFLEKISNRNCLHLGNPFKLCLMAEACKTESSLREK
ncbi:hypothetical protein B0H14DRAFT_263338 [Mycena olivaceomarginata]|nr:hypothetical protein B0H14DRAFT_263338 [Mycena olivaceomarginata]